MATVDQLSTALRNAHAAGDTAAATKLATALKAMTSGSSGFSTSIPTIVIGGNDSSQRATSQPDFSEASDTTNDRPALAGAAQQVADNQDQRGSLLDSVAQGLTFGFGDELAGLVGGVKAMTRGGNFGQGYNDEVARERADLEAERRRHPVASTLAELAGSLPSVALPVGEAAQGAGLLAKMGRAALGGAAYGGVYGAGASDSDLIDRAKAAAFGAAAGGVTGAALPVAAAVVRTVAKPVINAVAARIDPGGFAATKVAERIAAQGRTVDQVANRIDRARGQGQNISVAEAGGDSVRDLARTAVNIPGPARNRITAKVNIAQMSQGDRLKTAVADLFADPNAYQATKEGIIADRASAAQPYYRAAYARPIPYTNHLEEALNTPAGKAALAGAKQNSLNRREPWAQWFASIDDQGNIIDKRRVPDTRALDEVQRTLRGMVEDAKAQPDGSPFAKARATPKSIAIQSVRDDLLKEMDAANPAFAKARAVALDNIQADEALEFGRNALGTDSRVVAKTMAKYSDGQRQLARIGAAEALRAKIDKAGFTNNAVLRIFNSREQINGLKALFGNTEEFNRFRGMIFNEARKVKTRAAVTGNSTTARQLADMNDAGQMGDTVRTVGHLAAGNPLTAAAHAVVAGLRRLGGLTPQVADHIGRLVMTSDPSKVRGIVTAIRNIEQARLTADQRASAIRGVLTRFMADQEGRQLAQRPNSQLVAQ